QFRHHEPAPRRPRRHAPRGRRAPDFGYLPAGSGQAEVEVIRHPERSEGSQNASGVRVGDPSPSARLRMTGGALLVVVLAACTSVDTRGTASARATAWTPPASAVPPVMKFETAMPPATTLSLADVVGTALANNPATREAWLAARAAEANLGS